MNLRNRFAIVISGLIVLIMVIFSAVFYSHLKSTTGSIFKANSVTVMEALNRQAVKRAIASVTFLANAVAGHVYLLEMDVLYDLMRSAKAQDGTVYAYILDNKETVLHDGTLGIESLGKKIFLPPHIVDSKNSISWLEGDVLHALTPITIGDEHLGSILMGLSLKQISDDFESVQSTFAATSEAGLERSIATAAWAGGLGLMIAILVSVVTANNLSRPIMQLVRFTRDITRGDHPSKTLIKRSDEIGELATSLETMTQTLVQAQNESIQAMEKAEKASHTKSEFLASINHELRTPLTSSLGSLSLLNSLMADQLSQQGRELLEIALRNNEKLLRLVNELLDFEKILSGTLKFQTTRQDINKLTAQIVIENQGYAHTKSVTLIFKDHPTPIYADVHVHRFGQVLNNLLSNAAKFSEPGSKVHISINSNKSNVYVRVKDNGPGIPDEFKSQIYEKFTQADSSSTRQYGGTGLGLSISKALIENMGGTLDFETEVGVGSTFFISLPLSK